MYPPLEYVYIQFVGGNIIIYCFWILFRTCKFIDHDYNNTNIFLKSIDTYISLYRFMVVSIDNYLVCFTNQWSSQESKIKCVINRNCGQLYYNSIYREISF